MRCRLQEERGSIRGAVAVVLVGITCIDMHSPRVCTFLVRGDVSSVGAW